MTLPYRKKLIEVALPLEAINVASAREKSIRHGHPSTLHLWWARRPLAACRAVLFASLVDDPDSDPAFDVYKKPEDREHATGAKRQQLFDLITELVQWENSNNELVINAARAEIARCVASRKVETGELKKDLKLKGGETVWDLVVKGHGDLEQLRLGKARLPKAESVNAFLAEHAPPVLDPFAGGGSIPLEAQRLGLRAYASDLNPVPVLINKALIEIPPKFANMPPVNPESRHESGPPGKKNNGSGKALIEGGWKGAQGLAEDVRYYGKWMREEAEKRIGHLYPKVKVTAEMAKERKDLKQLVGERLVVDAWLWARTVPCINPSCRKTVPMLTTATISRDPPAYSKLLLNADECNFGVTSARADFDGTQAGRGARFNCPFCGTVNDEDVVRGAAQDGKMKSTVTAVACSSQKSPVFLGSNDLEFENVVEPGVPRAIDQEVSREHRCVLYGFRRFQSLFSPRQLTALLTFSALVQEASTVILAHSKQKSTVYAEAVSLYLAFAVDRAADYWSEMTTWMPRGTVRQTFARQRIAMNWDWVEANPFGSINCAWDIGVDWIAKAIERLPFDAQVGVVRQLSATAGNRGDGAVVISTDPPYYDNIPYADCSDYFYVWLRNSLGRFSTDNASLLSTLLTPKVEELVANTARHGGSDEAKSFFEKGLGEAFKASRKLQDQSYPFTVYYAFKQTESDDEGEDATTSASVASTGWETMLTGLVEAGFSVNGTWPVRTERGARNISIGTNALASSIVLSCRLRPADAPLATRREFLTALARELPDALKNLQRGNIAPVDLAQAAIGPGMAVFTRYAKVMEADGTPMKVRQALALINQTLDEVLAEQEGEFDGDTRWALAWFEQFGMEEGAFGIAETLSKAKNTAINGLVEAGLIKAKGGKVRLLKRDELPDDWDPATDTRLRHWEIVQHLIRTLDKSGEAAAAALLRKLGGMGEMARDLAYRLYSICERKKWASEALAYNTLVIAWPEITRLAQSAPKAAATKEEGLFR